MDTVLNHTTESPLLQDFYSDSTLGMPEGQKNGWVGSLRFLGRAEVARWVAPNLFSTTVSISAQPRWLY